MPTPTIKPNPSFNAEKAAQELRDATKGIGTDEKKIIATLTSCTSKQRVEIIPKYKVMFGKDLIDTLKSELGGNLENVVLETMMSDTDRDAGALRKAMKGAGTDEETLIDILATRSNSEITAIKSAYNTHYKRDLEKDLKSETSGHFERLLVGLVQGARNEGPADAAKAAADAKALLEAGEKKWGTDESAFQRVLVLSSPAQLRAINEEYKKLSKYDLVHVIEKEMSGSLAKGFRAVVLAAVDPATYFAERLYDSMAGAGTNDELLIRLVVSRSERDLEDIKAAFRTKYGKTLEAMIKGDCSGDYKKMLLALCGDH